jgi:hypothetical protein
MTANNLKRPLGLKPELIGRIYAALKRRSSTVVQAFVCCGGHFFRYGKHS